MITIHVAHLDPYNGDQSIIHAPTREALLDKIAAFFRDLLPAELVMSTEEVLEYVREHSESSYYTDAIEVEGYDAGVTQTAQIVWEAMLEAMAKRNYSKPDQPQWLIDFMTRKEDDGAYEMRDLATELAVQIEDQWIVLPEEMHDSGLAFDWELVPSLLEVIPWTGDAELPAGAVEACMKTLMADMDRSAWEQECKTESRKLWCYADLIDDHPERTDEAYKAGQKPADYVLWLGQKYGLTPARDW